MLSRDVDATRQGLPTRRWWWWSALAAVVVIGAALFFLKHTRDSSDRPSVNLPVTARHP